MISSKRYCLIVLVLFITLLLSCGKDSTCFKGTGTIIKEQREIALDVTNITTEDNIDIVITQSNEASMYLEGGENLLPYIKTDVSENVLSISSDNRCGMFRDNTIPITLYISLPNIVRIDYTGQGDIISANKLDLDFLDIDSKGGTGSFTLDVDVDVLEIKQHSGPADFNFRGKVGDMYVYTLGQGWFYLDNLIANTVHVNHSGIGDVFVNVKDKLSVEMRSKGSVYYLGSPVVEVSPRLGSGLVEQK